MGKQKGKKQGDRSSLKTELWKSSIGEIMPLSENNA